MSSLLSCSGPRMEPQVEQCVAWGNIHLIDLTSFFCPYVNNLRPQTPLSREGLTARKVT